MQTRHDRRRFIAAGSAGLLAALVGGGYIWFGQGEGDPVRSTDAIRVVAGKPDRNNAPVATGGSTVPALSPPPVSPSVDAETEMRLSRLAEGDMANSRQRMRDRRRDLPDSTMAPAEPAPPVDADLSWKP